MELVNKQENQALQTIKHVFFILRKYIQAVQIVPTEMKAVQSIVYLVITNTHSFTHVFLVLMVMDEALQLEAATASNILDQYTNTTTGPHCN